MNRIYTKAAALLITLLFLSSTFRRFLPHRTQDSGNGLSGLRHAVRVAIRKLPGIESVDVSLERATADIWLRAENAVTLAQLRQIIKNNGFASKEATVTVVGNLIERGGKPAIDVTGTKIVMLIVPDPKQSDAYKRIEGQLRAQPGQTIELRGIVESRVDQPDQIVVSGDGTG